MGKRGPAKGKGKATRTSFRVGDPRVKLYGLKKKEEREAAPADTGPMLDDNGALTPAALKKVTELASLDKSLATIATAFGMHVAPFALLLQQDKDLSNAYEVGRGLSLDYYTGQLRKQGKKLFIPNIFASKALHGLTDTPQESDHHGPQVVINIPGAQQATNVIEGERLAGISDDVDYTYLRPQVTEQPTNGRERITPVTHRQVGPNLIPLTMAQKIFQQREIAACGRDPYAHEPAPPPPSEPSEPTAKERQAYEDAKFKYGINTDRSSFTAPEWARYNRAAPPKGASS